MKFPGAKFPDAGEVAIEDANSPHTTAKFSELGDYVLKMTVKEGLLQSSATFHVKVHPSLEKKRLDVVYTKKYKIDNPLWNDRAKALIVSWIPYCIDQINRTDLELGEGGIDNFIESAKALRRGTSWQASWLCIFKCLGTPNS